MVNSVGKFGPYDRAGAGRAGVAGLPRGLVSVSGRTGVDLVRSRIALRVRLGLLGAGQRLPDAGVLAEELGISEITVRRALETMCQDGLLDRRRGRAGGTFVACAWDAVTATLYDADRAAALADFHLLLECGLVARLAGEAHPPELTAGLDQLAALVAETDSLDSADAAGLLRLETLFHLELARLLGGCGLDERVADLVGQLCLAEPGPSPAGVRERNRWHAQLLEALAAERIEAAVAALKAHGAVRRETARQAG